MADTETKTDLKDQDAKETLKAATEQAQAEIDESVRKQESYVYAAARARTASENANPVIDGDERTRTLTIADMNNAPTGIIPGLPGSQNPLAQALAKGDEDVAHAVEQVATAAAAQDAAEEVEAPVKKAPALPKK
jgi:DNA-directed RNA polymerase subunit K/omega